MNNLYAACISCNRKKQADSTRSARSAHGRSRAPRSAEAKKEQRVGNALIGGTVGLAVGVAARVFLGPFGWAIGTVVGALLGASKRVE
jgi:hypothetical protein